MLTAVLLLSVWLHNRLEAGRQGRKPTCITYGWQAAGRNTAVVVSNQGGCHSVLGIFEEQQDFRAPLAAQRQGTAHKEAHAGAVTAFAE
jgi:hypothetical protein